MLHLHYHWEHLYSRLHMTIILIIINSIKITFALASLAASASAAIALWSCTGSRQSLLVQTPNSYHRRFMFRAQHDVLGLLHLFWECQKMSRNWSRKNLAQKRDHQGFQNGMEWMTWKRPLRLWDLFEYINCFHVQDSNSAAEEDYDKYEKELWMKYCWAETLRNAA